MGSLYKFKIQSRNAFGFSADSNIVSIKQAEIPVKPNAPVTSVTGSTVLFDWNAPSNQGSLITSY
jgi:hypothetical protein